MLMKNNEKKSKSYHKYLCKICKKGFAQKSHAINHSNSETHKDKCTIERLHLEKKSKILLTPNHLMKLFSLKTPLREQTSLLMLCLPS